MDDALKMLDPCLHGIGPDHLHPFDADEDPLVLASDPDVTHDGSESGMPTATPVSTQRAKAAPNGQSDLSDCKVPGTKTGHIRRR